jgi:hypothetical protein
VKEKIDRALQKAEMIERLTRMSPGVLAAILAGELDVVGCVREIVVARGIGPGGKRIGVEKARALWTEPRPKKPGDGRLLKEEIDQIQSILEGIDDESG